MGIAVTYTVVGGDSLHAFVDSITPSGASVPKWSFYLVFGGLQVLLSMVSWWLQLQQLVPIEGECSAAETVGC